MSPSSGGCLYRDCILNGTPGACDPEALCPYVGWGWWEEAGKQVIWQEWRCGFSAGGGGEGAHFTPLQNGLSSALLANWASLSSGSSW